MDWVTSAGSYGLAVIGWVALSYAMVSVFEHRIHRTLMHRKGLPRWMYEWSPYLLATFEAHAVQHHGRYYTEFDWEPDPHGRELNLAIHGTETLVMMAALAPVFLFMWWISPLGSVTLLVVGVAHNRVWNLIHREMHIPNGAFFARSALFRFLACHHFMHHQQMNKNFNVVFPLADYVFRTVAKPRVGDVREMLRLGYLVPRSPRLRALVAEAQRAVRDRRLGDEDWSPATG